MNKNLLFLIAVMIFSCKNDDSSIPNKSESNKVIEVVNKLTSEEFSDFLNLFKEEEFNYEFNGKDFDRYKENNTVISKDIVGRLICSSDKFPCRNSVDETDYWPIAYSDLTKSLKMIIVYWESKRIEDEAIELFIYNAESEIINQHYLSENFTKEDVVTRSRIYPNLAIWSQKVINASDHSIKKMIDRRLDIKNDGVILEVSSRIR